MKAMVVGMLLLLPHLAAADIVAWQDANGVTHYTNLKGEIPAAQRDAAAVVVDESARAVDGAATAPAQEAKAVPAVSDAPRQAQVVYDRSQLSEAYIEGLQRGLEAARAVNTGGSVQINGPLAVAPSAPYAYTPYLNPLVTTSFDRGRSRHLTLRQLLENQFAIDRDGPFVFEDRLVPPFGHPPLDVSLNPFLPRGLPHAFPREIRVITR